MNLPAGATPVDFAYAIHTEVGHRTIGAKVNGKLVPLDYELRTGDTVDILTSKAQGEGPSQDWLRCVETPRARNKIRQWFSRERREDALEDGQEQLQRLMRKQNVPFKRLATEEALEQVADEMKYPSLEALFVAVGEGQVSPQSIVARLARQRAAASTEEDVTEVPLARPVHLGQPSSTDVTSGVVVPGSEDVWVRLARCCTPVPGDDILGFVTRGQGVSVHRTDCPNAKSLISQPERLIDVTWTAGKPTSFVVADPGRGARPHPPALGRRHGAVRSPREHPVGDLGRRARPHHDAAVHVRARGHHPPGRDPRRPSRRWRTSTTRSASCRAERSCSSASRAPRSRSARRARVRDRTRLSCCWWASARDDAFGEYDRLAEKVVNLRVFEDDAGQDEPLAGRRRRRDPGRAAVHAVRRRPQGPPAVVGRRRPDPRSAQDRVEAFANALESRGRDGPARGVPRAHGGRARERRSGHPVDRLGTAEARAAPRTRRRPGSRLGP